MNEYKDVYSQLELLGKFVTMIEDDKSPVANSIKEYELFKKLQGLPHDFRESILMSHILGLESQIEQLKSAVDDITRIMLSDIQGKNSTQYQIQDARRKIGKY